ncbi:MAG: hypothetical protein ABFS21_01810 [Actinomycetota bacterium]
MRKWWIVIALAVLAASCGEAVDSGGEPGIGPVVPVTETTVDPPVNACEQFIELTGSLAGEQDYDRYQDTLREAIRPVIMLAVERGVLSDEDQDQAFALERAFAGDARGDDLWAIEDLGRLLAAEGVEGCDELWHNLGPMPGEPPIPWAEAAAVEIDSEFEFGTADRACDVFIETMQAWVEEASTGAEYGPSMAAAAETLISELEALGIPQASGDLSRAAELWISYPWVRAGEESMRPLELASEALADVGTGRCGEVFAAIIPGYGKPPPPYVPPVPITVSLETVPEFDPGMACGYARVESMHTVPTTEPLDDDARRAVDALRGAEEEGNGFTNTFRYEIFSRTADELILLGSASDGSLSYARFDRTDAGWKPSGWGTCEWRADRHESVPWQVHPDYEIDPASSSIELLATDWCGMITKKGHEVLVVSEFEADTVTFEVWESHAVPPGPNGELRAETMECSMGYALHLVVDLPAPIGDRTVLGEYDSLDQP